jgi:hypothetical protein
MEEYQEMAASAWSFLWSQIKERTPVGIVLAAVLLVALFVLLMKLLGRVLGTLITFVLRYAMRKNHISIGSLTPYPLALKHVRIQQEVK